MVSVKKHLEGITLNRYPDQFIKRDDGKGTWCQAGKFRKEIGLWIFNGIPGIQQEIRQLDLKSYPQENIFLCRIKHGNDQFILAVGEAF